MNEKLEFQDHKQKSSQVARFILVFFSLVSIAIFIPFVYSLYTEENGEPIVTFILIPVFLAFALLPLLLVKLTLGKSKQTIFLPKENKVQFFEGKKLITEYDFGGIASLNQSRYSYTVKTKNGSRTVVVFTIISPQLPEHIIAESTDFYLARIQGESIAKLLEIPILSEQGEKREFHELDLPFHKRSHPEYDQFTQPNFTSESDLVWKDSGTAYEIISSYNPLLFRIVGICLSVALFLFLHLALGEATNLGIFCWETFPPTIAEIIFFGVVTILSLIPFGFVYYHGHRHKSILMTNEGIFERKEFISYSDLEEIILNDHELLLIGDKKQLKISLYLFCKNEDFHAVKQAVIYGVLAKTNGGANSSFAKFTTEF
ncbi:hypothetical protein EHQ58_02290 [Leptospira ognonensis]|uniref:Uncharacterized protein n=1 Tax=Leptospira ognonensis TaxID=2484945 RepID=A0A4R9K9Q2_9LEPT|nr:hypothetical protein [Leptospira ognonensis]TGL62715.1 hypothetical protein EHQ58_02290 [Leptospira ognonensis]